MEKQAMLYEGKAKKVYATEDPKRYVVEYKDDATAFNGEKKGTIVGKGAVNNRMSAHLFKMLEAGGVPTHFEELLNDREMVVKAVTILPLEVIIRNVAAGSMSKRLGIAEGTILPISTLEFSYKNDAYGDPLINDDHAVAMGLATREQLAQVREYAFKINDLLRAYFLKKDIKLIDFKLEFGLFDGQVILADEISPDTCRLWDLTTDKKLDKDRFRRDMGGVEEVYQEVLHRLGE